MVIPPTDAGKGKADLLLYFGEKQREKEFSFGDSVFQVLEGLLFIHLTNLWWAAHCDD